jgi:hypothetical protein
MVRTLRWLRSANEHADCMQVGEFVWRCAGGSSSGVEVYKGVESLPRELQEQVNTLLQGVHACACARGRSSCEPRPTSTRVQLVAITAWWASASTTLVRAHTALSRAMAYATRRRRAPANMLMPTHWNLTVTRFVLSENIEYLHGRLAELKTMTRENTDMDGLCLEIKSQWCAAACAVHPRARTSTFTLACHAPLLREQLDKNLTGDVDQKLLREHVWAQSKGGHDAAVVLSTRMRAVAVSL